LAQCGTIVQKQDGPNAVVIPGRRAKRLLTGLAVFETVDLPAS
jgi:hypothetical protein